MARGASFSAIRLELYPAYEGAIGVDDTIESIKVLIRTFLGGAQWSLSFPAS